MDIRTSVALYPYTPDLLPIVKHFEELQGHYSLTNLLSMPGSGLVDHDASYACNYPDINFLVSDDDSVENSAWNMVLCVKPPEENRFAETRFFDILDRVLVNDKSAIYCDYSMATIPTRVLDLQKKYPTQLSFLFENHEKRERTTSAGSVRQIDVPVIYVGGLVECVDTLEILCNLANRFRACDLHPLVISKHPVGQLVGFHTIEHIFKNQKLTESQKIEEINSYVLRFGREIGQRIRNKPRRR